MQQAHALVILRVVTPEKGVNRESAQGEIAPDYNCSEDALRPVGSDAEDVGQVAVHFVNEAVVVPGLPGPEPLPARPANEGSDENHGDPQDDEAEKKSADGELALLPGVIAATQRIGIYVGDDHQADDDERGHHHTRDPRIEINQHFLETEEIPWGLRGIHGE